MRTWFERVLCVGMTLGVVAAAASLPSAPTAALGARLRRTGRAEVRIERTSIDGMTGKTVIVGGTLVLEPPDRARLEFDGTGERITLRSDGGEWLQPALRQLLRFDAATAAPSLRWWALLLEEHPASFRARRVTDRSFIVVPIAGANDAADSARIILGGDRLPLRLQVEEASGQAEYRFRGWRFTRPHGRAAFVLQPPRGYEVVALH